VVALARVNSDVMLFPLIRRKKKAVVAVGLTLLCSAMTYSQTSTPATKQPTGWSLYLKTEGAPWTKKFEVELTQTGILLVTETDPQRLPKETTSKLMVNLAQKDAQEIYEQALTAFRQFRFAEEDKQRTDGTNLTLRLVCNGQALVMQFFHIGRAEDESADVAKMLALIDKHLAAEHQIY
jgi:hypothetical protein